jgi:hypothetical protein
VPRKTYKLYGVYDDQYRISADYDFFYRLIRTHQPISFVDQPIACMRIGGASGQSVRLNLKENYEIRRANGQGLIKAWRYTAREYIRHWLLILKNVMKVLIRG